MGQDELEIDEHKVPLDELVKRFKTDIKTGLTEEAARDGLAKYGPNTLKPPVPKWRKFFQSMFNWLGRSQAEESAEPPQLVATRRAGQTVQVKAEELTLGDIVELKSIGKIPADIRVIEADEDFRVDLSSLTGESEPQVRTPEFTHENPLETSNLVFLGTWAVQGSCVGMVIQIGAKTVYGRVAGLATTLEF